METTRTRWLIVMVAGAVLAVALALAAPSEAEAARLVLNPHGVVFAAPGVVYNSHSGTLRLGWGRPGHRHGHHHHWRHRHGHHGHGHYRRPYYKKRPCRVKCYRPCRPRFHRHACWR